MSKSFYISIDIGKLGAVAIQEQGKEIQTFKMPMIKTELDYLGLYKILEPYKSGNGIVVFERLGVIFGSSKQVAWSMGHQSGALEMACISLSLPYIKVPAKEWQKTMFQGVDEITKPAKKDSKTGKGTRDTKAMAFVAIQRLMPTLKLTFGSVASKPHDGLVDAILMNIFAQRNY